MATIDLTFERGLPANVDAERFVLGSILLNQDAYFQVAGAVEPDDFSLEKHRRIFARMKDLYDRGEKIDRVTLANELMKQGQLESVDGFSYLVSLDDGLPELSNLDSYIRIVKDKATLRKLIFSAQKVIDRCLIGEEEPDEILAGAEESLLKLGEARTRRAAGIAGEHRREISGRRQRVSRSQPAGQRAEHGLRQVRRNDGRTARRRAVHSGGAAFDGQDGAGAEHRAARGDASADAQAGGGVLARNVVVEPADAPAVRGGARGSAQVPRRISECRGAAASCRWRWRI